MDGPEMAKINQVYSWIIYVGFQYVHKAKTFLVWGQ